ncbi:MAG TPA: hypothetical protein PLO37_06565 [Candidatus Hydrogenedentes bacterium]|nr:hypothetical protein [Candidatus Hydrogenedentota bacterium]HPG66494.1 hypothetical protein [Candidatus Hydrogenedentota bacterium]
MRALICGSGQEGTILRRETGENLYGHDEGQFNEVGTIPLELNRTPPDDLPGDIDAVASVLTEADVRAEDRLLAEGEAYRVQAVVEERLFGVVTHKSLRLVKLHAG